MSANNGVIRIGRKGTKKFAFGEEGEPFEVDVVVAYQEWIATDETFRLEEGEGVKSEDVGTIPTVDMPRYHQAAVAFASACAGEKGSKPENVAEALDFIARLREQYDGLIDFFRPRSREKRDSPDTSAAELRFSEEQMPN